MIPCAVRRSIIALASFVAALSLAPAPTDACMHVGKTFSGQVTQKGQRLLVVHDGTQQTTVLRIDYDLGSSVDGIGLVIPVPAIPSKYATADAKLFEALETWAPLDRQVPQPRSKSKNGAIASSATEPPLELLEPVKTGPYAIQPMKARGEAGAKAVNEWLTGNDYAPIPMEALKYYVDNEWSFLAVKAGGEGSLAAKGALPPLSYTFESKRAVVPLKLEAQGVFPVRVYLVTTSDLGDDAFADAAKKGFEVAGNPEHGHLKAPGNSPGKLMTKVGKFTSKSAPTELATTLASASVKAEDLHLRVLFTEDFGAGAANPAKWAQELMIPVVAGDVLPPAEDAKPAEPEPDAKADDTPVAKPEAKPDGKAEAKPEAKAEAKPDAKAETKAKPEPKKGGGCTVGATPSPVPLALLLLPLLGLRRRRR